MQLVEQHVIARSDPRCTAIDVAAFKAKNLYNAALYLVRQSYIIANRYLGMRPSITSRLSPDEGARDVPSVADQSGLASLAALG